MEVLHRPGALYVPQMATLYPPGMQRMITPSTDVYGCYSFEVNTPSRTPTPERSYRFYPNQSPSLDTRSHATTLQSVLRGEIPPAYSHLATTLPASSHHHLSSSSWSLSFSSAVNNSYSTNLDSMHPAMSPCPSVHSSSSYSPRPSSHGSHASQDSLSDWQTEPMDLSCKKSSRKRRRDSAFLDVASKDSKRIVLSPSLPAKFSTSRASSSEILTTSTSSVPSSISPCAASMHRFPPSPNGCQNGEFSLLRNLLSVGKHNLTSSSPGGPSHSTPNLSSDRACESPVSESSPRKPVTGSTKVQLAKKNLFPISARVSDWLVKLVQFAKSIPEFSALSHNDQITLILNSWTRIMLVYMAESNFHFAVTPVPETDTPKGDAAHSPGEPTMKAVEALQTFIKKCQHMLMDGKEYDFIRMLVLFNSGYPGLSCPDTVDQLSSVVQQLLQQHVRVTRPKDVMHYSRLLMCLPSLYGTNSRMFETLFCKHITKNTDMEVLLKELLQSIS